MCVLLCVKYVFTFSFNAKNILHSDYVKKLRKSKQCTFIFNSSMNTFCGILSYDISCKCNQPQIKS